MDYDGAFEQLFSLGSGEFEQKFSKNSNARGVARGGGGVCLSFDLTDTLLICKQVATTCRQPTLSSLSIQIKVED